MVVGKLDGKCYRTGKIRHLKVGIPVLVFLEIKKRKDLKPSEQKKKRFRPALNAEAQCVSLSQDQGKIGKHFGDVQNTTQPGAEAVLMHKIY